MKLGGREEDTFFPAILFACFENFIRHEKVDQKSDWLKISLAESESCDM